MQQENGPVEAAIAEEQIAAQPYRHQRFVRAQLGYECTKVCAISRRIDTRRGAAGTPRDMLAHAHLLMQIALP